MSADVVLAVTRPSSVPEPAQSRASGESDRRYADQLTRRLGKRETPPGSARSASQGAEAADSTANSSSSRARSTSGSSTPRETPSDQLTSTSKSSAEASNDDDERAIRAEKDQPNPVDLAVNAGQSEVALPVPLTAQQFEEEVLAEVIPALGTREQIVSAPAAPWKIDQFAVHGAQPPALPLEQRLAEFETIVAPASFLNGQIGSAPSASSEEPTLESLPADADPGLNATIAESVSFDQLDVASPQFQQAGTGDATKTADANLQVNLKNTEQSPSTTITEATIPTFDGVSGEDVESVLTFDEAAVLPEQEALVVSDFHSSEVTTTEEPSSEGDAANNVATEVIAADEALELKFNLVSPELDETEDDEPSNQPSSSLSQATEQSGSAASAVNELPAPEAISQATRPGHTEAIGRPDSSPDESVQESALKELVRTEANEPARIEPRLSAAASQLTEASGEVDSVPTNASVAVPVEASRQKAQSSVVYLSDQLETGKSGAEVELSKENTLVRDHAAAALRAAATFDRPIRIRLSPPELGVLQVEVSRHEAGVTARFEVSSSAAHSTLNEHTTSLRETLARAGVTVDRIEVRLAETRNEDGRSREQTHQDQRNQQQYQHPGQENGRDNPQQGRDPDLEDVGGVAAPKTDEAQRLETTRRSMRHNAPLETDILDIQV